MTLTQKRLKYLLTYDPATGVFVWNIGRGRCSKGDRAGCVNGKGYRYIRIDTVIYQAHRLAFLYMKGYMPAMVDHDNHSPDENWWGNLINSTPQQNQRNRVPGKNNTSGHLGVSWAKTSNKWIVYIMVDGVNKYQGLFADKANAILARKSAEIKYGFHSK